MQAFRKMQNIHLRAQIQASSGEQEAVEKHLEGSILVLRCLLKKRKYLGASEMSKTRSCKLSSDLYMHTMAYMYIHVHMYNSYIHSCKIHKLGYFKQM